jgi:hypothetical protein
MFAPPDDRPKDVIKFKDVSKCPYFYKAKCSLKIDKLCKDVKCDFK